MRLSSPPTLLSLLGIILTSSHTTSAKPYVRRLQLDTPNALDKRCANPCGSESQFCCTASETCVTSGWPPIAQCVAGTGSSQAVGVAQEHQQDAGNGQYQLVTTTWTETDLILRTSTYSTHLASPTQQATFATPMSCDQSNGESPCGTICCAMGQYCQMPGQCAASGGVVGDVSSFYYSSVTATDFVRPTSNTVETVTSTGAATTTVPFEPAGPTQDGATAGVAASTTNNGLTAGQIAGIVVGVLLGILLLLVICALCCFRGLYDGFLAIFGLGKKRRRQETTYIEERHSHHTGGASRPPRRTWWGADRPARPKKDSGLGGAGAVAAGLGTLAVILGLKRRRDRRDKDSYGTRSSYSYGSYTGTSESE
ncbi:MAG: hypothetical protein LQ337_006745 [Flavoplaca oasis]|nr:MAG: hypothetical protein LQ337_006745 [Flavoplaca oasis]